MKPVAFVTGGSRGIGLSIAEHLAALGYDLAINGVRSQESVEDVLENLKKTGSDVIYCQGDIASANDRAAMIQQIQSHFGRLNLLVNNAGVAPKVRNDVLQTTEESFDFVINTNLKGTYFLTQAVANLMIEEKQKNIDFQAIIINVTSVSATVASVNRGEYCISKAGLGMVTQLFAVRLGEFGIPVYEIRPGVIKTDMTAAVTEKYDIMIANGLMVQPRWGYPDDIGRAVAAIANSSFPYSTGQVFMVDGGMTLGRL